MDKKTLKYYQAHADELAERYGAAQSGIVRYFEQAFAGKSRIIDVGCGTGRDLNTLLEMGFDAIGIDPCQELLDQAVKKYPKTRGKMHVDVLPDLKNVEKGHFEEIGHKKHQNAQKSEENGDLEPVFIEFTAKNEQFLTCLPFFDLEAAAGPFGDEQNHIEELQNHEKWVKFDGKITRDLFAIRIKGRSMEPRIPDGSIAVFRSGNALAGSRQGKIVLVQLLDRFDPDTNSRFSVKKYASSKKHDQNGVFAHQSIVLSPLNPDFEPIILENGAENEIFRVVGVFQSVFRAEKRTRSETWSHFSEGI